MPVKFVRKKDIRVSSLVISIYGKPGTGKTSLALTAKNPVLFDFDLAAYRAKDAPDVATVLVQNWTDIADLKVADLAQYDTVIVDTAGKCVEAMMRSIVPGGAPKQNDWGTLKQQFERWVGMLRSAGKDIIFVVHLQETPSGDEVRERFLIQGQSRELIYQMSDLIGKLEKDDRLGIRYITFDPTTTSYGKNADIDPTTIPHPQDSPDTMGKLIEQAKINLNAQSGESAEKSEKLDVLRKALGALPASPEEFNTRVHQMLEGNAPNDERQVLLSVAESKGLQWDKANKTFALPEPVAPEPTEELMEEPAEESE